MIPFEYPIEYLSKVMSGDYVRYGAILKDQATGQIVGHLKEAGSVGLELSKLTFDPISSIASIGQYPMLMDIQNTLKTLELITSIGAVSSVACLGVSVAGFVSVNNKLRRMENKLDSVLTEVNSINQLLKQRGIQIEALSRQKLYAATNELQMAEKVTSEEERIYLARTSASKFLEMKQHYNYLLSREDYDPWLNEDVSIDGLNDLVSRFVASIEGESFATYMIGDFGRYEECVRINQEMIKNVPIEDKINVYRARANTSIFNDTKELAEQVKGVYEVMNESFARIDTKSVEVDYIRKSNLKLPEYRDHLASMDSDLLLLT